MLSRIRHTCPHCSARLTVDLDGDAIDSVSGCVHARHLANSRKFRAAVIAEVSAADEWEDERAYWLAVNAAIDEAREEGRMPRHVRRFRR